MVPSNPMNSDAREPGGSGAGSTVRYISQKECRDYIDLYTTYRGKFEDAENRIRELRADLEAAQKEWHHWQRAYMNLAPVHEQLQHDLAQSRATEAELRAALEIYGRHDAGCPAPDPTKADRVCNCGLKAALDAGGAVDSARRRGVPTVNAGARLIPLTRGLFALVDPEDYEVLVHVKWHAVKRRNGSYYASRYHELMHRTITGAAREADVDHVNGDTLDNRRSNLRVCTHQQNMCNRSATRTSSSRFCGVHIDRARGKWAAAIKGNGKGYCLGRFDSELEAARAYDAAAVVLHGDFARLNFPDERHLLPAWSDPGPRTGPRSHCPRGHELTPENRYVRLTGQGSMCRACQRRRGIERRQQRKEQDAPGAGSGAAEVIHRWRSRHLLPVRTGAA